jgi:hypothetical protein
MENLPSLQNSLQNQLNLARAVVPTDALAVAAIAHLCQLISELIFCSYAFRATDMFVADSVRELATTVEFITSAINFIKKADLTDEATSTALNKVLHGLTNSVRQFRGRHLPGSDETEGPVRTLEANIEELGYSIDFLDYTLDELQSPLVRSMETIASMDRTIVDLMKMEDTIKVLEGSVAKLQGIDASTVEAVRVMGDSVGVMGTSVHSIEAAIQRLEALDWKSVESMHVMDQTLETLRAAVIRLDKIDVKTLDSMQSMIATIENMKLSLIKLDKIDLDTINSMTHVALTLEELTKQVTVLKELEACTKIDMIAMLARILALEKTTADHDNKFVQSALAVTELGTKIVAVQDNVTASKAAMSLIGDNVSHLSDAVDKLGKVDAGFAIRFDKTTEAMTTIEKSIATVGDSVRVLRDKEYQTIDTVNMIDKTVSGLRATIKDLEITEKTNVATISAMELLINDSLTHITNLEQKVQKLEYHSTKVLVVSIDRIEKINRMLSSDVYHLNECLKAYEQRPDKLKVQMRMKMPASTVV